MCILCVKDGVEESEVDTDAERDDGTRACSSSVLLLSLFFFFFFDVRAGEIDCTVCVCDIVWKRP